VKIRFRAANLFLMFVAVLLAITPPALAQDSILTQPARSFPLIQGWYKDRATYYYDFGGNSAVSADGNTVHTAPIYVPITGKDAQGNPIRIEGQRNIIDVIPGDPGYSDLWEVVLVTVPAGYQPNTLRSAADVMGSGFPMGRPGLLVNCPVVPFGSTLAEGGNLTQGWYKGQDVVYFDFGPNPATVAPIFAFITGMDAQGKPQLVPGQHNVIDVIPGDAGYSAFWKITFVTVPAGYQANSIRSTEDVRSSGFQLTETNMVVNCPVLRTDSAVAASSGAAATPAAMATAAPAMLPVTGGSGPDLGPWIVLGAVAVLLIGGLLLMAGRQRA
jgi:hypothetical protein